MEKLTVWREITTRFNDRAVTGSDAVENGVLTVKTPRGQKSANNKVTLLGVVTLRGGALTILDYVAIGVLIALAAWAAARVLPRSKL